MTPIPISLAVEDSLSESVLRRVLEYTRRPFAVGPVFSRGGFGYLRRNVHGWNAAAKGSPLLLLTDLDSEACPPALMQSWMTVAKHDNFLFRVAVREVEAWLLADHVGLAGFLSVNAKSFPAEPEALLDPKRKLVEIASLSKRKQIREDIVPRKGTTASQGPGYNRCLCEFVRDTWNIEAAELRATSLKKTIDRVISFTPTWTNG